ncbi:MAG: COG1361 S-layer family protein [archaeon]|nr:COG1361 S-layer family protein [archaeon]
MNSKIPIILGAIFAILLLQTVSAADVSIEGFNYNPAPAIPAQTLAITATLSNTSTSDAENVVVKIDLTDIDNSRTDAFPFILSSDENETKTIGTIKPGQSAIARFNVGISPNALNGTYTISILAGDRGILSKRKNFSITILSRKPKIELIATNASTIVPGEETKIELTLKNVGSSNALNILAGIQEDRTVTAGGIVVERQIYPVGNAYAYIESMAPNEIKIITLTLSANSDAQARTYSVPITMQWQDDNRTEASLTRYLGLKVTGEPSFDIIIDEVNPLAHAGGTSEITFNLFNAGVASAQNIVIEISTNAGVFEKNKVFIGTLESDDSDSFKTKIETNSNLAPGEYPITLKVNYKNAGFETRELIKIVNLRVVTPEKAKGNGDNSFFNIAIAIIIIAVLVYWFYWRKRNKSK